MKPVTNRGLLPLFTSSMPPSITSRFAPTLLVPLMWAALAVPAGAQPSPKYEFRAAWIATVLNLDWPVRGATPASQQAALEAMFDELYEAGINAVFFQVRSECDAMYVSPFEPWSYWLTGEQGRAPEPFYDPLQLAIDLAHERGMELHAWLNPYRAERSVGGYTLDAEHVAVENPDWTLTIGSIRLLNPGIPDVRTYIASIIGDVVRRYDVDGIHFDDYFYPYPPNQIGTQDRDTFNAFRRGFGDEEIGAWRRDNVNLFVAQAADSVRLNKPHVKFGISPFGIWKNGVPSGIVGLDAYSVLYADAPTWAFEGWVDYLVPQLYWPFGGGQDYGKLAPWWASVTVPRHLYIGHGLYRSDPATFSGTLFSAGEVPRQVRFNRNEPGVLGSAFFRAKNVTAFPSKGFADTLETTLYARPALTPPMEWKDLSFPAPPTDLAFVWNGDGSLTLNWHAPNNPEALPWRRYAVYRTNAFTEPDFGTVIQSDGALIGVTTDTTFTDIPYVADEPYWYAVTAVSPNSIDSAPTPAISVEGQVVSVEPDLPVADSGLLPNYPNPFSGSTSLVFDLEEPQPVSLTVYDALGRTVRLLVTSSWHEAGSHTVVWDGADGAGRRAPSGTYLAVFETPEGRTSRVLLLVR